MTSFMSSHQCNWPLGVQEHFYTDKPDKVLHRRHSNVWFPGRGMVFLHHPSSGGIRCPNGRKYRLHLNCTAADSGMSSDDPDDDDDEAESLNNRSVGDNRESVRENLERIVGTDDSTFSGIDLATLIRKKYGKSYDVQLIKKEFMGRNLLAMNVMWKYMEQRSFPLTEEEYILRLDEVANSLRCWGAVSLIRNTLEKSKERPRIGKAVSIFIDMDESGGRAREWIYK